MGLWEETFISCNERLRLAIDLVGAHPERAMQIANDALADADVVLTWMNMTDALLDAIRQGREIP